MTDFSKTKLLICYEKSVWEGHYFLSVLSFVIFFLFNRTLIAGSSLVGFIPSKDCC